MLPVNYLRLPHHRDKPEPDPEAQNYLYVCICYFISTLFLLLDGTCYHMLAVLCVALPPPPN
jgi:hypothetical protein